MATLIQSNERQVYTDASLQDAKDAILDGRPIDIWYYTNDGTRCHERILFTEFNYISETIA